MDRNLSFAFTWWDRLFGTWADPRTTPDDFRLGLRAPAGVRRMARMVIGI